MIRYEECIEARLKDSSVKILPEMLIHCIDTNKTLYFDKNLNYKDFTQKFIRVLTQSEFNNYKSLEKGKVYGISENKRLYNFERYQLILEEELLDCDFTSTLIGGTLYNNGAPTAPITLGTSVYHLDANIETVLNNIENQIFYKIQVSNAYVEVAYDNQKLFEIPFPFMNYTLGLNQMQITFNDEVINNKFNIIGREIELTDPEFSFKKGNVILFTFMYNTAIALNDFIISTNNIKDGSITSTKLADNVAIYAANIIEDNNNQFVSDTEKSKWNSKADKTLASTTKDGLMSKDSFKKLNNHETMLSALPILKTGISVVPSGSSIYTYNDTDIDTNSFILVTCNDTEYTATVEWVYGTMTITLNKIPNKDITVNWIIISPKSES